MSKNQNYPALDIMKIVCAILVISNHTNIFLPYSYWLNFIVIHIFARIVVPFYFFNSIYTIATKDTNDFSYYKKYLTNITKTYLGWSLLYIPIGLIALSELFDLTPLVISVGAIFGILNIGTYFHLWYLAALIFALFCFYIIHIKKQVSLKTCGIIAFILFIIGAIETYYGVLDNTSLKPLADMYFTIFQTTRNGLFFTPIYIVVGYYAGKSKSYDKISTKHKLYLSIFFLALIFIEAFICRLYFNPLNYNIYIMALPFTYFFYGFLLDYKPKHQYNFTMFRAYSSQLYFTHAAFLIITPIVLSLFNLEYLFDYGPFRFGSTLLLAIAASKFILYLKAKHPNKFINIL